MRSLLQDIIHGLPFKHNLFSSISGTCLSKVQFLGMGILLTFGVGKQGPYGVLSRALYQACWAKSMCNSLFHPVT